jgi:hypothetical protein
MEEERSGWMMGVLRLEDMIITIMSKEGGMSYSQMALAHYFKSNMIAKV